MPVLPSSRNTSTSRILHDVCPKNIFSPKFGGATALVSYAFFLVRKMTPFLKSWEIHLSIPNGSATVCCGRGCPLLLRGSGITSGKKLRFYTQNPRGWNMHHFDRPSTTLCVLKHFNNVNAVPTCSPRNDVCHGVSFFCNFETCFAVKKYLVPYVYWCL